MSIYELIGDKEYHVHHGDCISWMAEQPSKCVDFSVFSPPFPILYAYGSSASDIGNSEDFKGDMKLHLSFFYRQLARVLKPGRVVVVHVAQIPRMKRAGGQGLFDFRGFNIRLAERAGLVFEYDWTVRKNPQAQAIRTKSRELQFSGLEADRSRTRGCLPDYLLKFTAPGDNAVPINSKGQVSRNEWIKWAESCWDDIRETDTLNTAAAKSGDDTRHIAPLQLGVINRLVRLFSNPWEIVCSPFTGIGSEGYEALKLGRRFVGCELKDEYHAQSLKNLEQAIRIRDADTQPLFAAFDEGDVAGFGVRSSDTADSLLDAECALANSAGVSR